eukprot:12115244-Alexandrium_andersonii.AAC.1
MHARARASLRAFGGVRLLWLHPAAEGPVSVPKAGVRADPVLGSRELLSGPQVAFTLVALQRRGLSPCPRPRRA